MRRLLALGVSAAILAALYATLDSGALTAAFGRADMGWLAVSVLLLAPPLAVTAGRLAILADGRIGPGEALRLTLAAQSLNMVLPSKLGDVAKAWFMATGPEGRPGAVSLVVFEKACDLLALLAWCGLGLATGLIADWPGLGGPVLWLLAAAIVGGTLALGSLLAWPGCSEAVFDLSGRWLPPLLRAKLDGIAAAWRAMQNTAWANRRRALLVIGLSLGIWLLHLVQIWAMTRALAIPPAPVAPLAVGVPAPEALAVPIPLPVVVALAPLAILAGLLPLTFAGIGTRDAAFLVVFAGWMTPGAAAALGLLSILRYAVPALAGLPFVARYLAVARSTDGPAGAAP